MMITNNHAGGNILITGGTSGLGLELVKLFHSTDYNVWATGRDPKNIAYPANNFHFQKVDFSSLEQVSEVIHNLTEQPIKFNLIINNAGILSPSEYTTTKDGFEYTFQVNFLSHLLINELIIRNISHADSLMIISITSPVYKYVKPEFKIPDKNSYHSFKTYAESKLYFLLTGEYLHNKYPARNLRFIVYNPGIFSSGIYRMQKKWFHHLYQIAAPFMRSPAKVALCLTEILRQENLVDGAIYSRKNRFINSEFVRNESAEKFMKECGNFIASYLK